MKFLRSIFFRVQPEEKIKILVEINLLLGSKNFEILNLLGRRSPGRGH